MYFVGLHLIIILLNILINQKATIAFSANSKLSLDCWEFCFLEQAVTIMRVLHVSPY